MGGDFDENGPQKINNEWIQALMVVHAVFWKTRRIRTEWDVKK